MQIIAEICIVFFVRAFGIFQKKLRLNGRQKQNKKTKERKRIIIIKDE